jgi:nucleotide-binding universal stress UspA family protein
VFENILVAHNGSDGGHKAFEAALKLALQLESKLHMISVIEKLPRHAEILAEVEDARYREADYLERLAAQARRRAAFHSLALENSILAGHPVKAITGFASPGRFDLLVIGATNRSPIYGQLWGGTSHSLARVVPCSVLLVK